MDPLTLDAFWRKYTPAENLFLQGVFVDYESLPVAGQYNNIPFISFDFTMMSEQTSEERILLDHYRHLGVAKQDRFQAVPFHIHPWIELNYMYSGSCTLTVCDAVIPMQQGQLCLINTNAPHSISSCGENDILINFLISKDYLDSNFFSRLAQNHFLTNFFIETLNSQKNQDNYIFFHAEENRNLHFYLQQFLCEYYDNTLSSPNILDALMTLILCELINTFESDLSRESLRSKSRTLSSILRYIEKNYKDCTLKSTAQHFNMHPNYLSTYLKNHTGFTFKQTLQTYRLQQAVQLLKNTSLSVSDISCHVGYLNTNFFFQKFKEKYGCTPGEYRQKTKV